MFVLVCLRNYILTKPIRPFLSYTPSDDPFLHFHLPDWCYGFEFLDDLHSVAMSYPSSSHCSFCMFYGLLLSTVLPPLLDRNSVDKFLTKDMKECLSKLVKLRRDVLDNKEGAEAAEAAYIAAGKARIEPFKAFADTCVDWSYDGTTLGQLVFRLDILREKE